MHKEKQKNKVLFGSKTSSVHSCMSLIPTFNHFVNIVHYVKWKQPTIGTYFMRLELFWLQKEVNNANE